jgi:hypothetical protein
VRPVVGNHPKEQLDFGRSNPPPRCVAFALDGDAPTGRVTAEDVDSKITGPAHSFYA